MTKPPRLKAAFASLLILAILSGCSSPNMRSAVYQYGDRYALMDPNFGLPDAPERTNKFFYLPGAITAPYVAADADQVKGESMVWYPTRGDDCAPRTKIYTFNDISYAPRQPTNIEYIIDSRNLFIPTLRNDRDVAKADLNLKDFEIRWVRRIVIQLNNVRDYQASENQLSLARTDMLKRCFNGLRRFKGVFQIESVLAGDVNVEIDAVEGASAALTEKIRLRVLKAVTQRKSGNGVFFAVKGRAI